MTTESNPTRDAAARYAARGFRVIPLHRVGGTMQVCSCKKVAKCPTPGKHPVQLDWQKAEPMTAAEMDRRFGGERPYNIGIATGPDSGIFVVDIDPKGGGYDSMQALAAEHGRDWAAGYRVRTGSGGVHLYFTYPDFELGNKAGTVLGKGIDIRGLGGQVVAPPSSTDKGPYVLQKDVEIGPAPDWMLDLLRPKERKAPPEITPEQAERLRANRPDPHQIPDGPRAVIADDPEARRLQGYVDGALEHELGRLDELSRMRVPSGQVYLGPPWDTTTYEVAANLLELANAEWNDLTPDTVESMIWEHAPKPDSEGWTADRIQQKIDSARSKVDGEAAIYPPAPVDPFADFTSVAAPIASSANEVTALTSSNEDGEEEFGFPEQPKPVVQIPATLDGIPVLDGVLVPDLVRRRSAEALGIHYSGRAAIDVEDDGNRLALESIIYHPTTEDPTDPPLEFEAWVKAHVRTGTAHAFWAALGHVLRGIPDPDMPRLVLRGCDSLLLALSQAYGALVDPEGDAILLGPAIATQASEGDLIIEFDPLAPAPDVESQLPGIVQRALSAQWRADEAEPTQLEEPNEIVYVDRRGANLDRRRRGVVQARRGSDHGAF